MKNLRYDIRRLRLSNLHSLRRITGEIPETIFAPESTGYREHADGPRMQKHLRPSRHRQPQLHRVPPARQVSTLRGRSVQKTRLTPDLHHHSLCFTGLIYRVIIKS